MGRADVHFADNIRDRYLAEIYGFSPLKLTAEVPGWGGLKLEEFKRYPGNNTIREELGITADTNLLLSPRGFTSPFTVTDTRALILALPRVVERFPNTLCLLIGDMSSPGYSKLKTLAGKLKVEKYCRFINRLKYTEFLKHLAASDIIISVSLYDGCSISLIEGMACGVIPIMSDDLPKAEWVKDGWNGYLFNPRDPVSITDAIIKALENKDDFEVIQQRNRQIVEERADYYKNMKIAEEIYHRISGTGLAENAGLT
jgi:glycosyltransferase involved in cell wall biosynthesis